MAEEKANGPKMLPLKCRFCGVQTGEYAVPKRFEGLDIPPEQLGICDSRCDACRDEHGTVQEAERAIETALVDVGGISDGDKRKMIEESDWSAPKVIKATQTERQRRIKAIQQENKDKEPQAAKE